MFGDKSGKFACGYWILGGKREKNLKKKKTNKNTSNHLQLLQT